MPASKLTSQYPPEWDNDPEWKSRFGNSGKEALYARDRGYLRPPHQINLLKPPTVAQGAVFVPEHLVHDAEVQRQAVEISQAVQSQLHPSELQHESSGEGTGAGTNDKRSFLNPISRTGTTPFADCNALTAPPASVNPTPFTTFNFGAQTSTNDVNSSTISSSAGMNTFNNTFFNPASGPMSAGNSMPTDFRTLTEAPATSNPNSFNTPHPETQPSANAGMSMSEYSHFNQFSNSIGVGNIQLPGSETLIGIPATENPNPFPNFNLPQPPTASTGLFGTQHSQLMETPNQESVSDPNEAPKPSFSIQPTQGGMSNFFGGFQPQVEEKVELGTNHLSSPATSEFSAPLTSDATMNVSTNLSPQKDNPFATKEQSGPANIQFSGVPTSGNSTNLFGGTQSQPAAAEAADSTKKATSTNLFGSQATTNFGVSMQASNPSSTRFGNLSGTTATTPSFLASSNNPASAETLSTQSSNGETVSDRNATGPTEDQPIGSKLQTVNTVMPQSNTGTNTSANGQTHSPALDSSFPKPVQIEALDTNVENSKPQQTPSFNAPTSFGKSLFDQGSHSQLQSTPQKPSFGVESTNGQSKDHSIDPSATSVGKSLFERITYPEDLSTAKSTGDKLPTPLAPPVNPFTSASETKTTEPKPQFPKFATPVKPFTQFGSAQESSKHGLSDHLPLKSQEAAQIGSSLKPASPAAPQDGLPPGYTKHWDALMSGELSLEQTVGILLHEWLLTVKPPEAALKLVEEHNRHELVWKWRHRQLQCEWKSHMDMYGSFDRNILETFRIIQALRKALDEHSGLKSTSPMLYVNEKYFDEIRIKKSAKENMDKRARRSAAGGSQAGSKRKTVEADQDDEISPKKQRTSDVLYPSLPEKSSKTAQMFASVANSTSSPAKDVDGPSQLAPLPKPTASEQAPLNAATPQKTFEPLSNDSQPSKTNLFSVSPSKIQSNVFSRASDAPSSSFSNPTIGGGSQGLSFQPSPSTPGAVFSTPQPPSENSFKVPSFGSLSGANFADQFKKAAETTEKNERAKRKAEEFDSDEDDEELWEKKDQEAQRAKRARIEEAATKAKGFAYKPSTSSTPKQATSNLPPSATAANDFTEQFRKTAQNNEEAEKKRKASNVDSEEDDEEEWEMKNKEEEVTKKAKIEEAASKSKGFQFKPSNSATVVPSPFSVPSFGTTARTDFVAQFGKAAEKNAASEKRKRMEEDYDSEEETKEQWEERYENERAAKKAKIEEAAKSEGLKFKYQGTPASVEQKTQTEGTAVPESSQVAGHSEDTASISERKAVESSSPVGDHTWKPESPIKFADPKPSVTVTAPSPVKPNKELGGSLLATDKSTATNIFSLKSNSPTPSSGGPASVFARAGSPSSPSPANVGGSLFAQAISKPGSPANGAGSIFLQGGANKTSRPSFDFNTKEEPASVPSPAQSDGWQDFLKSKNQPLPGSQPQSVLASASLTPSRAVSPAISIATHSGTETDNPADDDDAPKDAQLDLKDTNAGEKDEDQVFTVKAKVMEFASIKDEPKAWQTRGVGELRLLRNRDSKKTRVVVRQEASAKVMLNAGLLEAMEYGLASPKMVNFSVASSDGGLARWLIQVGKPESAKELSKLLEENKMN